MRQISAKHFAVLQMALFVVGLMFFWAIWVVYFMLASNFGLVWITGALLLTFTFSTLRNLSQGTHGFIGKPQTAWKIFLAENGFEIQTKSIQTKILFEEITSVVISMDVSWDIPIGKERESMLLVLTSGGAIRIPGTSERFTDLREALSKKWNVETRVFDHDDNIYF